MAITLSTPCGASAEERLLANLGTHLEINQSAVSFPWILHKSGHFLVSDAGFKMLDPYYPR